MEGSGKRAFFRSVKKEYDPDQPSTPVIPQERKAEEKKKPKQKPKQTAKRSVATPEGKQGEPANGERIEVPPGTSFTDESRSSSQAAEMPAKQKKLMRKQSPGTQPSQR